MFENYSDKEMYISQMKALKTLSRMLHETKYGDIYKKGLRMDRYINLIRKKSLSAIGGYIRDNHDRKKLKRITKPINREMKHISEPDYFCKDRIAVYTCVFGNYDNPITPVCLPDNIDYYIITDQEGLTTDVWKTIDYRKYDEYVKELGAVEKNRWFKMHPHIVFGDQYRYSIYIDGNILPITDFTEFINRLGRIGIGMFWHRYNNCVYQEALFNIYDIKKTNRSEIEEQIQYLKANGMPENYGMTTCNVIARDHKNELSCKMNEEWWAEFIRGCKRDQLSFPFVAWKNGVSMSDIAVLGEDVWFDDSLMVMEHK